MSVAFATETDRLRAREAFLWMCARPPDAVRNPLELVRLGFAFDDEFPPISSETPEVKQLNARLRMMQQQQNLLLPLARVGAWVLRQNHINLNLMLRELGVRIYDPVRDDVYNSEETEAALKLLRDFELENHNV